MGLEKGNLTAPRPGAGQAGPHDAATPVEHPPQESLAERERRLDAAIAALNAFDAQYGAFADEHAAF